MYKRFDEERLVDFTRKLNIFTKGLEDKIINPAYVYSLPSVALEIARDKRVLNGQAWEKLLSKLSRDLTDKTRVLNERIEVSKKQFKVYLNDFRQVLALLREFKKGFCEMIPEANYLMSYYSVRPGFSEKYERISEEYNRYMDRLRIFSDDIYVKFKESVDESLTEHVKGFDELFPSSQGISPP
jgi:hypothetical protein